MNTYTYNLNDDQIKKIKEKYKDYEKISKNQYIVFFAKTEDTTMSIYTTNKIVIQTKNENLQCEDFLINNSQKQLNKLRDEQINKSPIKNIDTQYICGSDEVGCGDIFGPVVCSCVTISTKDQLQELLKLPIMDSKKLTDTQIVSIAKVIRERKLCDYSVHVIENQYYNHLTSVMNQNEIKMLAHLNAYKELKNPQPVWIIDEFASKQNLFKYQEHLLQLDLIDNPYNFTSTTKAEDKYLSVAIASIMARYHFLLEIYKIEQSIGFKLKLGASNQCASLFKEIKKSGIVMAEIAKLNFKNIK